MTTKQDIGMVLAFFVLNAIRIDDGAGDRAGFKERGSIGWRLAQDDDGFGWRITITP